MNILQAENRIRDRCIKSVMSLRDRRIDAAIRHLETLHRLRRQLRGRVQLPNVRYPVNEQ